MTFLIPSWHFSQKRLLLISQDVNPSRANDDYKRKNLVEYPEHIIHAVSVHYAQQRAGAVNIDFILYFLRTRWQFSSTFIMIYLDFFVPILQDAFHPAMSGLQRETAGINQFKFFLNIYNFQINILYLILLCSIYLFHSQIIPEFLRTIHWDNSHWQ
jgi:hypothetical protein